MRSVAKGNYIKGAGGVKHALAHVRYLQMRGGDDRDHALGGKRLFIDANRSAISGSEVNERIKQQNESGVVIHRVVLSPGIPGVDLDSYVRAVLSALKHSTGQDIEYYATKHRNTDHDHSHVVIMGRDEHGKQVWMNRHNYKTIREAGDRYLERNHKYDRFLDKELETLLRDGYKRDRGDQSFERLLEDLKNPRSFEECDEQRRNSSIGFIEEFAVPALPEKERIVRDNVIYTKYSSLEDLLELDRKLVSGELHRLPADQYQKMWSWIGNKKQFGDDYYVRTAEADRLHQQFDEDLKRSLYTDNSPPKSFKQYIFESRGRLLEWHEKYEINTQRSQLQKHIDQLDQSNSEDLEKRNGLIEQLDWLDAMAAERIESKTELPKIQRSKDSESSMQSNFTENINLAHTEERDRWGSELVERAWKKLLVDQPEIYDKASPQGQMSIKEALGREISKLTTEDHEQYKNEQNGELEKSEEVEEHLEPPEAVVIRHYENTAGDIVHHYIPILKGRSYEIDREPPQFGNRSKSSDLSLEPDRDHSCSDINVVIFGNEASITPSNKTQTDQQIDLWQKIAFNSDPDKHHQRFDQIMSQQVQQNMHQQIQQSFVGNQHLHPQAEISKTHVNEEQQRQREDERIDDGREHTR